MPEIDRPLKLYEAAWLLQLSEGQVRRLVEGGRLTAWRPSRHVVIESAELRPRLSTMARARLNELLLGQIAVPRAPGRKGPVGLNYPVIVTGDAIAQEERSLRVDTP